MFMKNEFIWLMKKNHITQQMIADELGLCQGAVSQKIRHDLFTRKEIEKLIRFMPFEDVDPMDVFFHEDGGDIRDVI